jgi:ribosomal protein S12 methylthiotransferase accessory factor
MSPTLFDKDAEIEWSPVWSLRDGRFKHLPTSLLYFAYRGSAGFQADSNGCAAGNTVEEAIVQGFLELVERDAYALWWYNRVPRPEVDLAKFDDSYVHDLRNQLGETGRRLWVLDITSDLGIPSYVAVAHWIKDGAEYVDFGSGSHFDARIAMLRTLTELNQFMSLGLLNGDARMQASLDGDVPLRLEIPVSVARQGTGSGSPFDPDFGHLDPLDQVKARAHRERRGSISSSSIKRSRTSGHRWFE